ncbi:TonB-dependent receptor plug domain-containing protein [Azonexus sp. IMCC34839]|uniref:TonB-dependent receptor plug domain-containing protein n=1 Tax=Azonexus sp. IMCC34839 TaxID=3133695 RepID=UPI003999F31F
MRTLLCMTALAIASQSWASDGLESMSLEDLLATDVTSVSRKSQSLADVPAAAFVISAEDIRRSGALSLPDVLRMAPGIQVAQLDSGRYAVSSRGFNGRFANKLQVLVDGRSIYHPIFSGTLWEQDPIPLEDIERIEVIRGPGAAMWGVNAVNGVINIISKHSRSQQGSEASLTVGDPGLGRIYGSFGAALNDQGSFKVSLLGRHAEPSKTASSRAYGEDRLNNAAVDVRFDQNLSSGKDLSIWFNASRSSLGDLWYTFPRFSGGSFMGMAEMPVNQVYSSENLMGRYRWLSEKGIESSLQMAFTRSGIDIPGFFLEDRYTFDLDYQGRYAAGEHDLLWGLSHRSSSDDVWTARPVIYLSPEKSSVQTSGIFLQDDWTLIADRVRLGLGARYDHSDRGGYHFSPNVTLIWTPSKSDTLWTKYARAPRLPSRAEQDISIYAGVIPTGGSALLIHNKPAGESFRSEKLEGFEVGGRKQFASNLNADLSAYRYRYTGLRAGSLSTTPVVSDFPPLMALETRPSNSLDGWVTGFELSADWLVTQAWRLQLSYSWMRTEIDDSANPTLKTTGDNLEKADPRQYGSLRSQWNLSSSQQFDVWLRGSAGYYRQNAPYPNLVRIPGYLTLDLRYAYKVDKNLELALIGRNLAGPRRSEFIADYLPAVAVEIAPAIMATARMTF